MARRHSTRRRPSTCLDRLKQAVDAGKILPSDVALSSTDQVEQLAQSGRAVFIAEGSQEASSFAETATDGMKWSFMPPPGIEAGNNLACRR